MARANPLSQTFSITNITSAKLPRLAFRRMKDTILGKNYDLSVVVVGRGKIASLNRIYRQKNRPTDILSFPLDSGSGEIYLNPDMTQRKAIEFGKTYPAYLEFLFIHGLVHLKGYDHGGTMERIEAKYRRILCRHDQSSRASTSAHTVSK